MKREVFSEFGGEADAPQPGQTPSQKTPPEPAPRSFDKGVVWVAIFWLLIIGGCAGGIGYVIKASKKSDAKRLEKAEQQANWKHMTQSITDQLAQQYNAITGEQFATNNISLTVDWQRQAARQPIVIRLWDGDVMLRDTQMWIVSEAEFARLTFEVELLASESDVDQMRSAWTNHQLLLVVAKFERFSFVESEGKSSKRIVRGFGQVVTLTNSPNLPKYFE